MSYRDMTFCGFYKGCVNGNTCDRALTLNVRRAAKAAGMPVARFVDPPECFKKPFSPNGESAESNE